MNFPITAIRDQFPSLHLKDGDVPRIYLDNPAGTQVPQRVIDAVSECFLNACANEGGYFKTSKNADVVVAAAHEAMADFLGAADPSEIILGPNSTSLGFQMSRSICRDFEPGDELILTRMDHEGNVAPWLEVAQDKGLIVRWAEISPQSWCVEPEAIQALIGPRTKLIAINYASNMTGAINDIRTICDIAKNQDVLVYVDAVQMAPHAMIDVQQLGCDFLVCSAYKFFGPHLGILWGKRSHLDSLYAYKCRCVPDVPSTKFETGTPPIELHAGLTAAVDYFAWLGSQLGVEGHRRDKIAAAYRCSLEYEERLSLRMLEGIEGIPGFAVVGPTSPNQMASRVSVISLRHSDILPQAFAKRLAGKNIFAWSGHNYALGIPGQFGFPAQEGVLRLGIAHYNTEAEIDDTLNALREIVGDVG